MHILVSTAFIQVFSSMHFNMPFTIVTVYPSIMYVKKKLKKGTPPSLTTTTLIFGFNFQF